jgi:NADPH-dependent glutamate synthase beta subunit-like oxidoreductase
MKITVDGKNITAQEGDSVLNAVLNAGIYIPHLCGHPDLEAIGGCRLCSVEMDGVDEAVPSCMTTVSEGMNIRIHGPKAEATRKMAMELILATHPADCTGCPKYGKCELQSMFQYMGVAPDRWRMKSRSVANDTTNPLIDHLFTRCIRCGRCVRACQDLRGVKVLDFVKTKDGIRAGIPDGKSLKEAGCRFCGACIEVCPTGSIMDSVGLIRDDRSYADSVVPCRSECPAGIDIPRYIRYIKEGAFSKATAVVREKVPFPETLGSICTHPCESVCKRNELGEPVSICSLKRIAASRDEGDWKKRGIQHPPTGKNVAVVGAGPAGLTAAYYLSKKGHQVTVFEANEKPGGQCRYGIPAYRLPDERLDAEIEIMEQAGLRIQTGVKVEKPVALLDEGFHSVLVATGTHKGVILPMEGNQLPGVHINTDFLKQARMGTLDRLEGNVAVLGGGNVAFDCGRTALRLGASSVHVICLENEEQMTATEEEIEEGLEEGIELHCTHSFLAIVGQGRVEGLQMQRVDKFYFDENRQPVLELVEGTQRVIPVDHVIFAVGQKPEDTQNMELALVHQAYIQVDGDMKTNVEGVFSAGDVVSGTKSVIAAIAAGRKAAQAMDRYLGGDGDIAETLVEKETSPPHLGPCPGFADQPRAKADRTDPDERKETFQPMEDVLDVEAALCEAGRCLQCDLRLEITRPKLWNEYQEVENHG